MPGIDSFTKLMLHCNGVDATTTFTDSSPSAHTQNALGGTAQIDTAQSKFGGASGLLLPNSYVQYPDSTDWDYGTGDMTIDFWYRPTSVAGSQCWVGRPTSGTSYFYFAKEGASIRFRDYDSTLPLEGFDINFGNVFTFVINTWYHVAVSRSGNNFRLFIDGVQKGVTKTSSNNFIVRATPIQIGANSAIGYYTNGHVDELRISKGIARWTANFTPPTQEYSGDTDITVTPDVLTLTSNIISPVMKIDATVIPSVLTITSQIEVPTVGQVVTVTPDVLTITSSIPTPSEIIDASISPPVLTISSVLNQPIFPVTGSLIAKIISVNPLIAVTDTSPVKIIKIDTTDPENLDYVSVTIPNINNAKDVTVNNTNDYVYVAGSGGKVVKVEIADLSNQTTFDVNDTDDFLTIEYNTNYGLIYAGTDSDTGELYTLDERTNFKFDSDFTCLAPQEFKFDSSFNIVSAFKMDSVFTALSEQTFKFDSDFKCLTKETTPITSIDDIIPITLEDFQVFVDSVELGNTDLILSSISITHSISEESRAIFKLSRQHDNINTTLEGVTSTITNQNLVEIKIRDYVEFSGKIGELDCQYQNNEEFISVTAFATEKENKFNNVTLSLPGVNSRLSIYDILIQNPNIFNPYIDPDDDDPKKYKGIKVNLGKKLTESHAYYRFSDDGRLNTNGAGSVIGYIANQITDGTFVPLPNWTYFWSPDVVKIGKETLGGAVGVGFDYIGTSLAPVSGDLWQLINAGHFRQKVEDDIETGKIILPDTSPGFTEITEIVQPAQNPNSWYRGEGWGQSPTFGSDTWKEGYKKYETFYYVGEAPFKEISVRNGQKITFPKVTDQQKYLAFITGAGYNFIQYAKAVADLEYEKLKNINGNILPDTSCNLNLTVDAYLYYTISLLTRINVDNTTQADIYKNANGFPVSAKSITITSEDRKVNINADNTKSTKELETINSQFPDEDDQEYNVPEHSQIIAGKSDMRTGLEVE